MSSKLSDLKVFTVNVCIRFASWVLCKLRWTNKIQTEKQLQRTKVKQLLCTHRDKQQSTLSKARVDEEMERYGDEARVIEMKRGYIDMKRGLWR